MGRYDRSTHLDLVILFLNCSFSFVFCLNHKLHVEEQGLQMNEGKNQKENRWVGVQDVVCEDREQNYHQRSTDPVSCCRKRHDPRLNHFRNIQPHYRSQRNSKHPHEGEKTHQDKSLSKRIILGTIFYEEADANKETPYSFQKGPDLKDRFPPESF